MFEFHYLTIFNHGHICLSNRTHSASAKVGIQFPVLSIKKIQFYYICSRSVLDPSSQVDTWYARRRSIPRGCYALTWEDVLDRTMSNFSHFGTYADSVQDKANQTS